MERFDEAGAAAVIAEVAAAVGLQEGEAGVRAVLRAVRDLAPASARVLGRHAELPVPLVTAVAGELRRRGLLTNDRPARLAPLGVHLVDLLDPPVELAAGCPCCAGHGVVIPPAVEPALTLLAAVAAGAPAARLELDQSHCTVHTKLRRVLYLLDRGILPGSRLLLLGDDDLVAASLAVVGGVLGRPVVTRLAVVDVHAAVLDHTAAVLAQYGQRAELIQHDLREPLPDRLRGEFDAVLTDPPYTTAGARLFLTRAVQAVRPGPGRSILFCFGGKGPDDALAVERARVDLGLVTTGLYRNFNEYLGAGVISSRSHLYHLVTSSTSHPADLAGHEGPLYTAEQRDRGRFYQCLSCAARYLVGPGQTHHSVAELQQTTCPACGGQRFRPLRLDRRETAPGSG